MLTRSQLENWDNAHLKQAEEHWNTVADQWETSHAAVHREATHPGGSEWFGRAAEAAQQKTAAYQLRATGNAYLLREGAMAAGRGFERLEVLKQDALDAISATEAQGFAVGEDLSVTDATGATGALREQRHEIAKADAAYIRSKVGTLLGADAEVSAEMRAATMGIHALDGGFDPQEHQRELAKEPAGSSNNTGVGQQPSLAGVHALGNGAGPDDTIVNNGTNINGAVRPVDFVKQDGGPQPAPQPGFIDQYEQQLTSLTPQAPAPMPMPSSANRPPNTPQSPGPMPVVPPPQSFGQCVGDHVKENVGNDMIKDAFKSAAEKAAIGAAGGAMLTPEAAGAGALPGAVLGWVGGFAEGLIEAPLEDAAKGALECADEPIPKLPLP